MASLQHAVLEDLESARNYNAWIASLALEHMGDDPIEVGSGTGTYAALWLAAGLPRITASEVDPALVERLRLRFAEDPRVRVQAIDLRAPPTAEHSAVVALNVLEHVDDDVAGLRALTRLVRAGGSVVVFVPAFPFALSRFDRAIGHYRRYTSATLRQSFEGAGLGVDHLRYINSLGLLAWFVGMRLLRMTPRDGLLLRMWDRLVIPVVRTVERRAAPPFGQSLVAVGRVAATPRARASG